MTRYMRTRLHREDNQPIVDMGYEMPGGVDSGDEVRSFGRRFRTYIKHVHVSTVSGRGMYLNLMYSCSRRGAGITHM
jgi:hypothetical protein